MLIIYKNNIVNNLRTKIDLICQSMEDLLKHGPQKPAELRGLKETENIDADIEDKYKPKKPEMPPQVGTRFNEDQSAQRTGWILEEDITNTILKGVLEAKEYISSKRVDEKKTTSVKELLEYIDLLKAGVMIGYPAYYGLPEWEPCRYLFEDKEDICFKEDPQAEVISYYNKLVL
jgi:hypothetical protein